MEQRKREMRMIGYYNYTVILTYIGMLSGFAGITYLWNNDLKASLICLIIAGVCDMFDGKIASTMKRTKQEKRFGIQIDSLSDLICFGVLPALIVFHCSAGGVLQLLICGGYALCALIRLAWFNVDEEERQDQETGSRTAFLGLPVTTSALLLPLFLGGGQLLALPVTMLSPWLLALIAAAFIVPIPMNKPKLTGKVIMILCGMASLALVFLGM